jgi:hypothetical protein
MEYARRLASIAVVALALLLGGMGVAPCDAAAEHEGAVTADIGAPSRAARDEIRDGRALRRSWAQLIKRIYEVDPLICPSCGSEMKVIAFITEHDVVDKILRHLKRRDEEGRGRGPPEHEELDAVS